MKWNKTLFHAQVLLFSTLSVCLIYFFVLLFRTNCSKQRVWHLILAKASKEEAAADFNGLTFTNVTFTQLQLHIKFVE